MYSALGPWSWGGEKSRCLGLWLRSTRWVVSCPLIFIDMPLTFMYCFCVNSIFFNKVDLLPSVIDLHFLLLVQDFFLKYPTGIKGINLNCIFNISLQMFRWFIVYLSYWLLGNPINIQFRFQVARDYILELQLKCACDSQTMCLVHPCRLKNQSRYLKQIGLYLIRNYIFHCLRLF